MKFSIFHYIKYVYNLFNWLDILPVFGYIMNWDPPQKPVELTEKRLIEAILNGTFPIGTFLPAERELAKLIGVTRGTLREALQRLKKDGWIQIHQGQSTLVRDYLKEGNLGVLSAIAQNQDSITLEFIINLLIVRCLLAPSYVRLAFINSKKDMHDLLLNLIKTPSNAKSFAKADWYFHIQCSILSKNPVFTLILNGFSDLYIKLARIYFKNESSRNHSLSFYKRLLQSLDQNDNKRAENITYTVMQESIQIWKRTYSNSNSYEETGGQK